MWPFRPRVERKSNPVGAMLSWTTNQAIWTDRNYEKLAEESYVRNAVAFKCVKLIASSAATVPWLMQDGDKEIDKHALLDLLSNPSPMIGGHALFEAYYAYLLLAGNSYLVAPLIGSGKRPPAELWNLRPDRMKIVPGPFGVPQAFEYTVNGQTKRFQVDPMTGAGEVLHVKEFHPTDDWYGLSRVQAGAYGIDRHNAASAHNKALLDNGARPSGALVFQPVKGDNGSERAAPQEVVDAARENLKERVGPKHAGEPFVFGGNVDWLEMGVTPKDMDFLKGKEDAARDICYAFGVPDILIVPGSSTYNNVAEAKLDLWEQTILPLIDHTLDALNSWLVPRYGNPNLRLGVDLDEISALEPRRESKRASVSKLLTDGVIDADEAREALQYGPRPPGALRLQRGDGPIIAALVAAAQADTGMLEPLYRYLVSAGLVDAGSTSLDAFITQWDGAEPPASMADSLAALGADPASQDAIVAPLLPAPKKSIDQRRTLYVSRPMLNTTEFVAWAKEQGFASVIAPTDLHTTIAFSTAEVDWSKLEPENETIVVTATVDRSVSALGDKGAVVLHFASSALTARWREFRAAGASWDFPGYQPHVSITYDGTDVDLTKVKPFMGQLIFGPETFAEVNTDWQAGVAEQ